jgi:hypothetical protein
LQKSAWPVHTGARKAEAFLPVLRSVRFTSRSRCAAWKNGSWVAHHPARWRGSADRLAHLQRLRIEAPECW